MHPAPPFRLTTFGELALRRADGALVVGPARKPLALLALVAAHHPAGIERARAAELLWPEPDPERARHTLAQSLYALRRACGRAPLVLGEALLRLDAASIAADVVEFRAALADEDAEAALLLQPAPFLEGLVFPGCVAFDAWASRARALARAELVDVARAAARRVTGASGATAGAAAWARALVVAPTDTELAVEAGASLAAAGAPGAARALLAAHLDEVTALGREPDPQVRALCAALAALPPHAAAGRSRVAAHGAGARGAGPDAARSGFHGPPAGDPAEEGAAATPRGRLRRAIARAAEALRLLPAIAALLPGGG